MRRTLPLLLVSFLAVTASGQPLPDLVIDSISVSPDRVAANEPFTLKFTVKNVGTAPAAGFNYSVNLPPHITLDRVNSSGYFQIGCSYDGGYVWCRPQSPPPLPLLPGERATATITAHVNKEGNTTHDFVAQADRDLKVTEISDSNNIKVGGKLTIIIRPKVSVSCPCPTVTQAVESSYTFNCTLKNIGTVTASNTFVDLTIYGPANFVITNFSHPFSPNTLNQTVDSYVGRWIPGTLFKDGQLPWSFTLVGKTAADNGIEISAGATDMRAEGGRCNLKWR